MEQSLVAAERISRSFIPRCELCQKGENGPCIDRCPTIIADQALLPRAYATLPWQLDIRDLKDGMQKSKKPKGVFARTSVQAGTAFGPLHGVLVDPVSSLRPFHFGLVLENKLFHYNLESDNGSNWMKFVRISDTPNKVNLMAYQHGRQVYFTALKPILEDEELCVGYSYQYALAIGKVRADAGTKKALTKNPENFQLPPPLRIEENSFMSLLPAEERLDLRVIDLVANDVGLPSPEMFHQGSLPPRPKKRKRQEAISVLKGRRTYAELTKELLSKPVEGVAEDDDQEEENNPDDADYEAERMQRQSPKPKKIQRKRLKQIEICGALVELTKPTKRSGRKEKPLTEVERLLVEKKLTTASTLLAKHRHYEHPCKAEGCLAEFRIPGLLAIHETTHRTEIPRELATPGPKKCPGCETEMPSFEHLVKHVAEHQRYYNKKRGMPCETCGKVLASEKMLARHNERLHMGEVVKPFGCDKCDGKFVTLAGLKSHENFQHGSRKGFECPVCLETFSGSHSLNAHSETHRVNGKFSCRICKKVYDSWLVLRRHMKEQHLPKDIVCGVCQKASRRMEQLTRHAVVHSDVFNYPCDICGRKFKRQVKLMDHQKRLHNPHRQYTLKGRSERVAESFANAEVCKYCHRQYNSEERLLEHQWLKHAKLLSQEPSPA
ncbi:hypothetical protein RvY_19264 [Ramazzottius varieornatus]|uniref:SET domain-containing protein n=1 Tax=Ramazzottius varieornatus TaxID=947166 RepID=A0A1D1WC69_RAMVA|nr:hypothetical protein RvY_19264 [Ramazzottius varieornatus]